MALSDDIKKVNDEISKLRKELGKLPQSPFDIKDIEKAKESLKGLRAEIRDMDSDLTYVKDAFVDIVNELSNQNRYLVDARNSLKGISSISQKITEYRKGETSLSEKQLKNLQQQAKTKFDILKRSLDVGNLNEKEKKDIEEALKVQGSFTDEVQRTIDAQKQANKEIGLLGVGIGGAAKALAKMGFGDLSQPLQDAIDKTKNARIQTILNKHAQEELNELIELQGKNIDDLSEEELQRLFDLEKKHNVDKEANKQKVKDLESQNKELETQTSKYKNIGKALKDQITSVNILDFIFKELIVAFGTSQKSISELARGLGMSASNATQMRQEFAGIANSSMNANISVKGLQESQLAVGQALGTNAMLNEKDLITMTDIVKKTGLQHDELVGIEKLSLATGKSLDSNVKSALGGATAYASQNKLAINNNKILKEVNKASSSLKLSLGGSVEALGKAVVQAQKFGITLDEANSLASSLLDFESSIENELSAELLTGKNLNLERARQLSLEGNIAEAAEEVLKQLKGSKEFSEMNVIQQEAMAKAVGLTRDELASSLIEREALQNMSMAEGETALERYNDLKNQKKTQAEIVEILGKETAEKLEQQSAQDKFNASVEKLREVFVQVMDAVAPIFDILSSIATVVMPAINFVLQPFVIAFQGLGKIITGSFKELTGWETVLGSIALIATGIYATMKAIAIVNNLITFAKITQEKSQKMQALSEKQSLIPLASRLSLMVAQAAAWVIMNPLKAILGLGLAAGAGALIYSQMQDGVIGPGGEMVVSGPKGSIQLDKDDSIVAGTNLFDKNKSQSSSPQSTTVVDMTKTNTLLQQLIDLISAGGDVVLDGQKVGVALNLVSYKTQ
jgi:hypothetical protein